MVSLVLVPLLNLAVGSKILPQEVLSELFYNKKKACRSEGFNLAITALTGPCIEKDCPVSDEGQFFRLSPIIKLPLVRKLKYFCVGHTTSVKR